MAKKQVSWKDSKGHSHTTSTSAPSYKRHKAAKKAARTRKRR